VEIYGVAEWAKSKVCQLFDQLSCGGVDYTPYVYFKEGVEAIEHLFSVASGLDSMVIGETEITGQIKQAYQAAQEAGLTGRITNRWFQVALQVAKEIRTETAIGRGATSVGSVAVELAERIFDHDLTSRAVMIIGAGKMGEACVKHLAKKGARSVMVSNRSFDRAQALALEFGGRAVRFEDCLQAMGEADIVVSSTGSPHTILHREELASVMRNRRNRPLFLIDIAVPRDIDKDVQELENVYLYNVDHLETIVRENLKLREAELARCQEIITNRASELLGRFASARQRTQAAGLVAGPNWFVGTTCVIRNQTA
jgi:glutamyl-tRNA reductase